MRNELTIDIPSESIHHWKDLEEDILGIALIEPLTAVKVANYCHADWFYYDFNKMIFNVLTELVGNYQGVDCDTVLYKVWTQLGSRLYYGESTSSMVYGMTLRVVSGAHIEEWMNILYNMYKERNINQIKGILDSGLSGSIRHEKISQILAANEVVKRNTTWMKIGDVIDNYLKFYSENMGKNLLGISSGFKNIDWYLNGFKKGEFTVIGARPSVGKSAFAQQIAVNVAKQGFRVGIVTLEMTNENFVSRMFSYSTGIDYTDLNKMHVPMDALEREMRTLRGLNIIFSEETKSTIESIRASVVKLGIDKLDLLIIDYLQLMGSEARVSNRVEEINKITTGLKQMSKENLIPVVALAQLNRDSAKAGAKPDLTSLRGSGDIEQDADNVLFIHGEIETSERLIIIAKNRNGKVGEIPMNYNGSKMAFTEAEYTSLKPIEHNPF